MRQGIIGFVVGVLFVAAVVALAGKQPNVSGDAGKYHAVVMPGFATKDTYVQGKVVIYNTETGTITSRESQ